MSVKKSKGSVYFVASLMGKEEFGKQYQLIADAFRDLGYEVWDDVNKISFDEAKAFTKEEITKYFSQVQKKIKQADIFVAEESQHSSAIGYEIGFAVGNNKPALVLRLDHLSPPGAPFRGNPSKLLNYVRYNEKNLKRKIEQFIRKAEKGLFVKRLPIEFTQNQVEYVEYRQISGDKKTSFNAAVRALIDEVESKDEKYKEAQEILH